MKARQSGRLRRWMTRAVSVVAVAGLVGGVWATWDRLDAPLTVVKVAGELTAGERARAIEIVASFLPAGVFEIDTEALQERLVDESWIDAASVRRRWPDTVEIRISPEVAVARWRDDALLSSRGVVIEPLELVGVDSLPRLAGPDGSEESVMQVFQIVTEVLRPLGLQIVELEQDAAGDVLVVTASGLEIALGSARHAARLRRVATVVEQRLQGRIEDVARLDARYDNGVAVAWRDLPLAPLTTAQLMTGSTEGSQDTWPLTPQR